MDIAMKIKGWAKALADVGVSLIALGIVFRDPFQRAERSVLAKRFL